ncbi:O-linked N-acetylglucosamine transferase, SPINDLY family protein [Granulicella cerasi]|uniref:O-linked N-acetylglucosamine transferase, SPINDLY family protein n=1 Tax=Granulicella cerasi TaxID=741063 RepID=UPI0021E06E25|nr:glycosyltransferase family 41 protein [Granulicella cerasi]
MASLRIQPSLDEQDAAIEWIASEQYSQAEKEAHRLLQKYPRHVFGLKLLAAAIAGQERWTEALEVYRRAFSACEGDWQFLNNYANALKMSGYVAESVKYYRRACVLVPAKTLDPHYNLGLAYIQLGDLKNAELTILAALNVDAMHPMGNLNLGNVYNMQGRHAAAELHYRAALHGMEDNVKLQNNLALCLRRQNRYAEAEKHYRRALEIDPHYVAALSNFSEFMALHGFMHESMMLLREALSTDPQHVESFSNLLFTLGHVDGITREQMFAEHLAFAARFEHPLLASQLPHANVPDPDRPLRVGFVSADLRNHPVVRYLPWVLEHLQRQHPELCLIAYYNYTSRDAETELYQGLFQEWNDVAHLSAEAFAHKVRLDRIDILIDLNGHSGSHRLLSFARKPAPVQVSWMGYVGTTGMKSMDYFIADPVLVPEEPRAQFTEELMMLPATTAFQPCTDAPDVAPQPALASGVFTFACLARMNKISPRAVALWSRILLAAPHARLMLATMADGEPPKPLLAWFAAEGIGAERLHFVHMHSVMRILELHREIDLVLDTVPYNGSTSSSHSLWMGVPTLTLTGDTIPGRMGTTLNLHTGLEEFIASSEEEFVCSAVQHAFDARRLAELRPTMRERFLASPLGQPEVVANALAAALRKAWAKWCAAQE